MPSAHRAHPCETVLPPTCLLIEPQRVTAPSQLEASSSPLKQEDLLKQQPLFPAAFGALPAAPHGRCSIPDRARTRITEAPRAVRHLVQDAYL